MDSRFWALDPRIIQLNHGSLGACPRPVLAEQQRLRVALEAGPTRWFDEDYLPALDASRRRLAEFVQADIADLAFVTNATGGVNAALASLAPHVRPGEEILVTDHAYDACRNAVDAFAGRTRARVTTVAIPYPVDGPEAVAKAVLSAVNGLTKVALLDHVTAPSAVVMPIERLVAALEPEVTVIVDGAHAPGMLPLNLRGLGASFYIGNCHKWLCAPKGAAFIAASPSWHSRVVPNVVSHGWTGLACRSRFHGLFDWPGTQDPTAWLSVPTAIDSVGALHTAGWPGVMAANRTLALTARELLCETWGTEPPTPPEMIGALATVPLPTRLAGVSIAKLTDHVRSHGIEAKFVGSQAPSVRLSAQFYNTIDDYERLADALGPRVASDI